MCGRYVLTSPEAAIRETFSVTTPPLNLAARYNIGPMQAAAVIRTNPNTGDRALDLLDWGLVPHWAKDAKGAAKLINARAEGVAEKPSFRSAFAKRRCLVVNDGFYEWQALPGGGKQPWFIRPADPRFNPRSDSGPYTFAGLWEGWKDPETGLWRKTFTILTTAAPPALAHLHARMPVFIAPDQAALWLGEAERSTSTSPADLLALLPCPPNRRFEAWRVGPAVGAIRNDDPSLMDPLAEPVGSPGIGGDSGGDDRLI